MTHRNYVMESLDTRSGTTDAEIEERDRFTTEAMQYPPRYDDLYDEFIRAIDGEEPKP